MHINHFLFSVIRTIIRSNFRIAAVAVIADDYPKHAQINILILKSDEMSSTSMDITETFRAEDLSKTDFFDFVTAPDLGIGVDRPGTDVNGTNDQPLQGYDQFWGAEKDTSRLESAIFEDLNRYCWSQQNNSNGISNQTNNTDGQIYTLTVLNGTEPWLRIDNTPDQPTPALDFDSMLGNNFPGYVKTEYTYDDSGFGTDNKDELIAQSQHQQSITVTNNSINSTNMSFQNNNNDWQMADHNANIEEETPESLLRSALQGKGYSKGMQLQNGITVIPAKNDDELRRALFVTDQDSLSYADSTLNAPLYDDNLAESPNSLPVHTTGVVVDDMFLTLDASAFTDDFDKIKRIASDVQQFCISTDSYQEIVTDVGLQSASSEVTTTNPTPSTKTPKKYKKSAANNNNNNNNTNNNNNSSNNNNLNNNNNSPTHCNGQRKERSLHYCSICSKGFKDKYSVNVHIRTHTGEKPFACSLCGKSFRQKAHLAKHYQTHLAQKNAGAVTKGNKQQQQQQQSQPPTQPLPSIQQVQLSPLPQITSISSNGQIVSNR